MEGPAKPHSINLRQNRVSTTNKNLPKTNRNSIKHFDLFSHSSISAQNSQQGGCKSTVIIKILSTNKFQQHSLSSFN